MRTLSPVSIDQIDQTARLTEAGERKGNVFGMKTSQRNHGTVDMQFFFSV